MERYSQEVEKEMRAFYETLSEKDRRRYAAIEARKIGYGGQGYISSILGCATKTIQRGQAELEANDPVPAGRIRRAGGGRKPFDKKRRV